MPDARAEFAVTSLPDKRVFVCGGQWGSSNTAVAWVFNPASNTWQVLNPMQIGRIGHTATALPNNQVLIAGGSRAAVGPQPFEVYNPAGSGQSTVLSEVANIGAHNSTATPLVNGDVILTGGYTDCKIHRNIQIYRFATSSIVDAGLMTIPRTDHTATRLFNEQVLLTGGAKSGCPTISAGEAELVIP
jgi:hypothetical protein